MNEKDTTNDETSNFEKNNLETYSNKYFDFFEHAPIALYIEDFSKLKAFVEKKAKENNLDLHTYLINNSEFVKQLHHLVIIKEVNATAVKLFKAKTKSDLLKNLERVFTPESADGFFKLVVDILSGKNETAVETTNKTFEGDEIQILIKFSVKSDDNQNLNNVIVSIENITNRKDTIKALAISEKRYKESLDIAKLASWFYEYDTKQLFWSDEAYKMLGTPSKKGPLDIEFYLSNIHKDDLEVVNDFSVETLISNPNQELNYRIITTNGEIKYLIEKRSVSIKNGKIQQVVGLCKDNTEKVLSGQSLNVTKQLLSNTLSNIQDGFVILDENSNYLYVNQEAANLLGKDIDYLIGKHIWDEFPEHEGDVFFDNYQQAFKTRKPISFENYFAPWNRWFENRIIPSNDTMLMFFHETTEKKESESKIKAAYNIINKSSSVAILCENKWDFPVVFTSENSEKLFGYTSDEFMSHQIKIYEIVHPEDIDYIRNYFFNVLKSNSETESKPTSFRIITKNGEIKWIETQIDIIKNSNNKITHIQGIAVDVTERIKAEELFFKSNQRLQDQFNNTPLASIIWDLDFKVIDWNNSAQRIFGYSLEEARGKHAKNLILIPEHVEEINEIWKNLLKQKGGYRNKNENVTKYGNIIICDWYNVTLKDTNGNIIGAASLVDDITEKNNSKILLEKSEKKYRDIFEKSIDPVVIIKDLLIVDCNTAAIKMFGFTSKEDLVKTKPVNVFTETQLDGSDSLTKAREMVRATIDKGSNRFRWQFKLIDGTIFPAEVTLTKIDDDEKVTIHAVIKDISEKVKKEQIETILYNISKAAISIDDFNEFGYFIKDQLHKIIDTSNFYIALYNEEKDSYFTPVIVDEMEVRNEFPAEGTLTDYVVKSKKSLLFNSESHEALIKDGKVSLVGVDSKIWVGVPLYSTTNVFGAIVVQSYTNENAFSAADVQLLEFVADQISSIILRKNTDFELKKALSKAQESDRLKSAFLANMSHEIRTPMNGIIGFSELFLEKDLSYSERKEYAKIVINSSKQLLSIVNDILDISKIEAGVVQLNYENVSINELLNNLLVFYTPIAKEKKLDLSCVKDLKNNESIIKIDKTKLNQILTNLLSNAFKFTDKGSIEFGYELIDNMLRFYVKDTGVGIDQKLHDKIFDRFVQADVNFEKQNKGTGLGLAISKKFIELFEGEIWLSSDNNEGTTIYFTIPYKNVMQPINTSFIRKKPSTKAKNKEITILVAEDEVYNLMYINELFSKTSYKIIEATNGKEAVEIALSNPEIDLILMDIKMPIMNGKEALKEIKKVQPQLPIIALSAFAMESDKEIALSTGFDSYLSKPLDKNLLFEMLQKFTQQG